MKTGIKLVAFMVVFVFVALAIGEGLVFGSRVYAMVHYQGFDIQTAVQWTWNSTMESIRKEVKNEDPLIIEMVNKNIQIVACTAL